jgi:hypothetical protein
MNTRRSLENEAMSPMERATLAAATLRLVESDDACDRARRQLHAQQRAAVLGGRDDTALDEAVLAYRAALAAQAAAGAEWRRLYSAGRSVAPQDAPVVIRAGAARAVPAVSVAQTSRNRQPAGTVREPAPEERFVRWLSEAVEREDPALAA